MKHIMLCGKPRGCCPEIWIDYDTVTIQDDDDHRVSMTIPQFRILKKKIVEGEFDHLS